MRNTRLEVVDKLLLVKLCRRPSFLETAPSLNMTNHPGGRPDSPKTWTFCSGASWACSLRHPPCGGLWAWSMHTLEHRPWGSHLRWASVSTSLLITKVNQRPLQEGPGTTGITLGQGTHTWEDTWFPGHPINTQAGLDCALWSPHRGRWQNSPAPQRIVVPLATTHNSYKSTRKAS